MFRIVVLLLIILPSTAHAFSAGGHRIIAEIAWRLLNHFPRFVEDFAQKMPDSARDGTQQLKDHWLFLEASVWPDTARGIRGADRAKDHRGTWHYINFPMYLNPDDAAAIDLSKVNRSAAFEGAFRDDPDFNIVQAIKANLAGLRDASRTKPQRAVHLCWVMHLVGDAHQPLHSTALFTPRVFPAGDRGGNLILVDRGRNLHSLWDRLLPNEKTVGGVGSAAEKLLKEGGDFGLTAAEEAKPESWLRESWGYARELAYSRDIRAAVRAAQLNGEREVKVAISDEYLKVAGHLARRRAVEAGYRLALMLRMQ